MVAAELVGDIVVTVIGGTTTDGSIILTFSTDVVTDDADIVLAGAWTGTIGEAAGGGTGGFDLDSVLAGVPEDALVNITLDMTDTDVTGTVHLDSSDFTDIDLVEVGAVTATATQAVGDGTDLEFTIQFNPGGVAGQDPNPGALETLVFSLELVADDTTDLEFPTDAATVTLAVTAASTDDEEIPYFLSDFMPDPAANLFNIVAANCTLLSNLVNFNSAGGIRTGIAIANTSAYDGVQALTGGITFTFYPQDEDGAGTSFTYTTDGSSPGLGLNAAGELEPGGTYTVLLSEVLDAAGFDGDFSGHYFAVGDFLYCHGLNLLTDFNTFSQGYIPEVVPSIRTTGPTESLGQ